MINDDDSDYYDYDTFIRHQALAAIHHVKTQPRLQMLSQSKLQKHLNNNYSPQKNYYYFYFIFKSSKTRRWSHVTIRY